MIGKLSVALLILASPAVAADPNEIKVDESGQAYRIKKVCQTVEVSGSFIPRTSCVNKKIPVKKPEADATQATAAASDGAGNPPAPAPEE
jgi:hypothetical protein